MSWLRAEKSHPSGWLDIEAGELLQLDKALKALSVISATLPMPLIAQYLGATSGASLAQLE